MTGNIKNKSAPRPVPHEYTLETETRFPELSFRLRKDIERWTVIRNVDAMLRTQPNGNLAAVEFFNRVSLARDYNELKAIVSQYVKVV